MFDITPFLNLDDQFTTSETSDTIQAIYGFKYAVALLLQPKSILEIGVRYGYSAASFLSGAPGASYVGLDNDGCMWGGVHGSLDCAATKLNQAFGDRVTLHRMDTQTAFISGGTFDLIHVDGDHSYEGCMSDLENSLHVATGYILIDDQTHHPDTVGRATKDFIKAHALEWISFDTPRGDILLRTASSK